MKATVEIIMTVTGCGGRIIYKYITTSISVKNISGKIYVMGIHLPGRH